MVDHLVLFKTKADATDEQKTRMISALKDLRNKIPGILELSVGYNFSDRNQGYDIGLLVRFVDRAALEAYGPHPAHQECVREFIAPIKEDNIVVDYAQA